MSRPVYDIEHDSDGWWIVTRNGWRTDAEFLTRQEAEAAIDREQREDEEAEEEARDQDEEYGARADYEYDRNR